MNSVNPFAIAGQQTPRANEARQSKEIKHPGLKSKLLKFLHIRSGRKPRGYLGELSRPGARYSNVAALRALVHRTATNSAFSS